MSAKPIIERETLIEGSIKIIKKQGIENLSARNLAKEVGCSTQPIFRLFKNMEDLKMTVYDIVYDFHNKYINKENNHQVPFIGVGLSYIKFAKKEKNLFKFLFMSSASKNNNTEPIIPIKANVKKAILKIPGIRKNICKNGTKI